MCAAIAVAPQSAEPDMAVRKTRTPHTKPLTALESADYTQGILFGLEKLAHGHSQTLLSHLLEMARREALWLSKK